VVSLYSHKELCRECVARQNCQDMDNNEQGSGCRYVVINCMLTKAVLTLDKEDWTTTTLTFAAGCWGVSWSLSGNVLAVTVAYPENKVMLYKEKLSGEWDLIQTITGED
jgi:hypothetical protein